MGRLIRTKAYCNNSKNVNIFAKHTITKSNKYFMKTKRTVFIYNTKVTTEEEAKYIVDILNCDDSILWDESDHDGVEVFEVPVESNANQETFEEFLEREGYPEGRTQEIWEDGARRGAEWQAERMYSEEEVLQLLLRLQQTESYNNLYEWFEQFKTK